MPVFIIIDDSRIKISNIKNYGISSIEEIENFDETKYKHASFDYELYRERVDEERLALKNAKAPFDTPFFTNLISERLKNYEVELQKAKEKLSKLSEAKKNNKRIIKKYLYITTYQNDNYRFYENESKCNIDDKLKELDKYLA